MDSFDRLIGRVATPQLGLITRAQLLSIGLSSQDIAYRVSTGRLTRSLYRVYLIGGTPPIPEQPFLAAQLARSEATPPLAIFRPRSFWRFEGFRSERPEVSVARNRRPRVRGVVVHRTQSLDRRDVTRRGPFRITTPARTLVDIAEVVSAVLLEDALDDVRRRRLTSLSTVQAALSRRGCQGVKGVARLQKLIDERTPGNVPGSCKENDLRRLLRSAGLPQPVGQHTIRTPDGRFVARVDFAYPEVLLAIEYDGEQHADRRQWQSDLVRQNRLINAGWRILRYTHDDLAHRPDEVVAEVRAALMLPS